MKKMFLFAFVAMIAMGASAQMNVWENGGLSAQYAIENVDSVTFGITSETPSSGTGKDGITPLLKIENDYWYISYDEGQTWQQEGRAKGKDGQDGDSIFQSVTQDENYVYFTLADGTVIKIAKGSDSTEELNPDDIIEFTDFNVRLALIELGVDTNKDGEISYVEAANVTRLDFASHKFTSFREFKYFQNLQAISFYKTGVRELVFPANGVDSILDNAFEGVKLKDLVITEGTKYIGTKAFYNSPIENLVLPNSVTEIGKEAFVGSAITSFVFPSMITYMPEGSFVGCKNLQEFTFPENYNGDTFLFGVELGTVPNICPLSIVYWNVITYDKSFYVYTPDGSISRSYYGLAAVLSYHTPYTTTTYPNTNINSVIFGDKVQYIPNYLCAYLDGLTEIHIPNSVITIGDNAFKACRSLNTVTIGDAVKIISPKAFEECSSITSITLPNSIAQIGDYAFSECSSLQSLYCKATTPPSCLSNSFPSSIKIIYVPKESVDEYKVLWSYYADKIVGYDFE